MAKKYTTGFCHYVHFTPEEDLGAEFTITTDGFIDVKVIKDFLQEKEEDEKHGELLTLEEAVNAIYDYMREFYSVVSVKGSIKYYGEKYIYEID